MSFLASGKSIFFCSYSFAIHLAELGYPNKKDIINTNVVPFGILKKLDNILSNPKAKVYIKLEFINISVISIYMKSDGIRVCIKISKEACMQVDTSLELISNRNIHRYTNILVINILFLFAIKTFIKAPNRYY